MSNPTAGTTEASIRDLLRRTVRLYRDEGRHPGPWEDCARIIQAAGDETEEYRDLYPDLTDIYCDIM